MTNEVPIVRHDADALTPEEHDAIWRAWLLDRQRGRVTPERAWDELAARQDQARRRGGVRRRLAARASALRAAVGGLRRRVAAPGAPCGR
jgi:hypothetical protein